MRHGKGSHEPTVAGAAHSDAQRVDPGILAKPVNRLFNVLEFLDAELLVSRPRGHGALAAGAARIAMKDDEAETGQHLIVDPPAAPGIADRRKMWAGIGLEPDGIMFLGIKIGRLDQDAFEDETVGHRDL